MSSTSAAILALALLTPAALAAGPEGPPGEFFGMDVTAGRAWLAAPTPVAGDSEIGSNDFRISDMGGTGDPAYRGVYPALAYNPIENEYLAVWEGDDNTGGLVDEEFEIFGQILSASGGGVGSNDFRISDMGDTGDPDYYGTVPDVAFDPVHNRYLVVWSGRDSELHPSEEEIYGQLLNADGSEFGANDFRISDMGLDGDWRYSAWDPAVVYNPIADEYLVVWSGDNDLGGLVDDEFEIFGQRLDSAGNEVGANDFRISDMGGTGDPAFNAWRPRVAVNTPDNEYLVVWYGDDNVGGQVDEEAEIFGQLLTASGGGTGPNDYRLSDAGGIGDPAYVAVAPSVAYNSTDNEYLVVWTGDDNVGGSIFHEYEVFSQRLSADLGGLGANDFRLSDAGGLGDPDWDVASEPKIAYQPLANEYLVCWTGEDNVDGMVDDEWEVFCQRLSADIQGLGPNDERISDAGGLGDYNYDTGTLAVAANSRNGEFLAVWYADENYGGLVPDELEIFAQRLLSSWIFADGFESGDTTAWSAVAP